MWGIAPTPLQKRNLELGYPVIYVRCYLFMHSMRRVSHHTLKIHLETTCKKTLKQSQLNHALARVSLFDPKSRMDSAAWKAWAVSGPSVAAFIVQNTKEFVSNIHQHRSKSLQIFHRQLSSGQNCFPLLSYFN